MSELSDRLRAAIHRSEDGAGTLSARESVKLRPGDYHAICDQGRAIADALDAQSKLLAETVEVLRPFARADGAIGTERGPFRFETGTGFRLIERDDLAKAGALYTKLTGTSK